MHDILQLFDEDLLLQNCLVFADLHKSLKCDKVNLNHVPAELREEVNQVEVFGALGRRHADLVAILCNSVKSDEDFKIAFDLVSHLILWLRG